MYFAACDNGITISGDTGTIFNPGYPATYGSNVTCSYTINMAGSGPQAVQFIYSGTLPGYP